MLLHRRPTNWWPSKMSRFRWQWSIAIIFSIDILADAIRITSKPEDITKVLQGTLNYNVSWYWNITPPATISLRVADILVKGVKIGALADGSPPTPVVFTDFKSRYSLSTATFNPITLTIKDVQPQDAGEYAMILSDNGGETTFEASKFTLDVLVPPSVTHANITVNKTNTAVLMCSATGNPTPNVTWTRSGKEDVLGTGETLTFSDVKISDGGCYVCTATNNIGSGASGTVCLTVPYKPVHTNITGVESYNVRQCGAAISLTCSAVGEPQLIIYHLYMDNLLIRKNINGMFHNILLDSVGIHLLTCVPINDAGVGENRSVSMNVTEKLPTISITPLRATVNEGSVVVFTCLAIGFQSFKNFWKKDGVFKGDGSSLTLSSVGTDDRGNYTCNVTSTCGTTMKTASLDVIYKPENTTLVSNSTLGCVGDIVLLTCSADGKPSDVTHSLALDGEHLHASEAGIFLVTLERPGWNNFTCIPSNTAGKGEEADISIFASVPPLVAKFPSSEVTIMEGHPSKLMCNVTGSPVPNATWYKQGFEGWYHSGPMLVLSKKNDAGSYRCIATNEAVCKNTSTSDWINVTFKYKPENTTLVSNFTLGCVGDIVLLTCSADGKPSDVTHSLALDEEHLHASEAGIFLVTLERPGWNNFTCIPSNTAGKGEEADISIFASVPPLVAEFPSSEVTIMEGHPAKLMCNVTGSPVPNATWYKQGFEGWYHSGPMLVLSKKNDAGSYRCIATNEAVCKNTSTSHWINVTYKYIRFIKPLQLCPKKGTSSVNITMETDLDESPDFTCSTGRASIVSFPNSQQGRKNATYAIGVKHGENVTCWVDDYPQEKVIFYLGKVTKTVMSFKILNREIMIVDGRRNVSSADWRNINQLVVDTLDSCLRDFNITFRSGSVVVDVMYTLMGNVLDPPAFFKQQLLEHATKYNFNIDPGSIQSLQSVPDPFPTIDDVIPTQDGITVTWLNPSSEVQCTMRARVLAGRSRDWVTSSGSSSSASLSCVLDDLEPDTLYEVEVTVSVRGDTRRDTVYIRTTPKAVKIGGQDSAIVGLAVVVAILVLVIIGLIAYVMWLKRAGKKSKRDSKYQCKGLRLTTKHRIKPWNTR
ncbi:hemicentin-2 isoform X2 [Nematostella vectensis]|uniref:hemicentin-2 isoform X2 n=1 Tax=Nematostella vectensis TaxID=45351 RepID=UPI0020771138|nr:hemicentin-2 isoform X2 [Nematostella vectensis]